MQLLSISKLSKRRRGPCSAWRLLLGAAVITVLCSGSAASRKTPEEEEKFIGWKGETYHEKPRPVFTTLSWEPRIFHAENLLSSEEINHLIEKAKPKLRRSGVVSVDSVDKSQLSDIRTSKGMFFNRGADEFITAIEARIAEWLMVPVFNGEGIQVLEYEHGQKYDSHFDYFFHKGGTDNGGNRLVTVLMYLSDVEEGGETVFPNVPVPPSQKAPVYSPCAMKGLAVKPKKGDAVAFWSLKTDGRLDQGALHGGCPVIKGVKWSATKWLHVARFAVNGEVAQQVDHIIHVPPPPPLPPGCANLHDSCSVWAESGECEKNAEFMVGTRESPGSCIGACGRCDLGPNVGTDKDVSAPDMDERLHLNKDGQRA